MRFIEHQYCAGFAAQPAQRFEITGGIAHHPDIGHHWFGKHTGNVTAFQCALESFEVVELNHRGGRQDIVHLPDQAGAHFRFPT